MKPKKQLLYIGNKLAKQGKSPTTADTLPPCFENEGLEVIVASDKKNKIIRLFDMMRVTYQNHKEISLVIIDTYSTWNFYYAVLIATMCRKYKLPYVPILHGGNLPQRIKKSKYLSRKLFNGAKTNVAPSKYLFESFKKEGFHNLTYIPNTIALKNYPFLLRKTIRPKLLWVRSFAELYNPLMAIEIVEILKKQGFEIELCMVGPEKDGSMQRCKKAAEELNLPVTFTGILKKEEWISLSEQFDIFINTTNFDNTPVSVMEAMALGLPIISTNVGGMPFLIDSGVDGVLVPPNNPQAFVEVILDFYNNPLYAQKLSLQARLKTEGFDWQNLKHRWKELFEF